jgi:hypothetical protein
MRPLAFRDMCEYIVNECVGEGPAIVLLLALIDLHALDFPICPNAVSQLTGQRGKGERERGRTCFGECRAILLHVLLACRDARSLRAALFLARNTSCRPY